jgi:hypothetical protein
MTVYWHCMVCPATGTGDRAAEKHVRDTGHSTQTYARPRTHQAIPFTLTDAGWAVASEGWVS